MSSDDLAYASAGKQQAALQTGDVSAVELTHATIDRIERHDGRINAVVVRDFDRALDAARHADAARARGAQSALLGVPMTVKESFNVAGLPTTWGLPPFRDFIATEDAVAVAQLKSAGAIVVGKTNVPVALGDLQTYNPIYGTTNNPWDLTRTPGGSSGGSAAALAAGFGALSLGSDIAGSLRVPAHFTGVFSHKPTFGLLSSRGHTPPRTLPLDYTRDLSVIGPMARTAADLELLLELLTQPDDSSSGLVHQLAMKPPRHGRLADFRVLVLDTHPVIPTSSEIRQAIDDLTEALIAAGATVARSTPLLPDPIEGARIYMRLLLASIAASYRPDDYERARQLAQGVSTEDTTLAAERSRGAALSYRDWIATDAVRVQHRAQWAQLFTEFDIVLCPAAPSTAFPHDHSADQWSRMLEIDGQAYAYADQLVWSGVASGAGLPSTVVPIALSPEGLPIGVQLIGPLFEDRTTLQFARLLEERFASAPAAMRELAW